MLMPRTSKPFAVLSPENTTFCIDLHNVLMQPNYGSMVRRVLLRRTGWSMMRAFLMPSNLGVIIKLLKRKYGCVSEEIILVMSQRQVTQHLHLPLIHLVNDWTADAQLVSALEALKNIGYRLVLFSNVGEECLESLREQHAALFALFSAFHCARKEHGYAKKPGTIRVPSSCS